MPVKAKCAEGNTDDKLSPSSVMYSTQLACKYHLCSTIKGILYIHNKSQSSENTYIKLQVKNNLKKRRYQPGKQ
jgi:hypothetical protein